MSVGYFARVRRQADASATGGLHRRPGAGKGVYLPMSEEPSIDTPVSQPGDSSPEGDVGQPGDTSPVDERTLSRAEWRAQRRAERRSRRGGSTSWILGAILIVLGLGFLAQTFGRIAFNNWWALFIFIPVVGLFAAAGSRYQAAGGRVTGGVLGSVLGGLVLSAVALAFLFNLQLNWDYFWPLLLILGGLALLLQVVRR